MDTIATDSPAALDALDALTARSKLEFGQLEEGKAG